MSSTSSQLDAFHRDGFVIVPDLFDLEEMKADLAEMEQIFYGNSFAEYMTELDATGQANAIEPVPTNAVPHYSDTEFGHAQFPAGADALDWLIKNDEYLDIFEQCLGTDEASYCNAYLFMCSGPTDKRHPEFSWQGYHIDHYTNCFLPPSHAVGAFDYVNSGVYLHDMDDDCAPMYVIPGSHRQVVVLLLRLAKADNLAGGGVKDIRKVPKFAKPAPTTAKTGSALSYSSYLVHAAVPFENERKQRALWTLSMARTDNSRRTKLANPWTGPEQVFIRPFWQKTTPRVRSLFGWPPVGHSYYTEATLQQLALLFPGMDVTRLDHSREGRKGLLYL